MGAKGNPRNTKKTATTSDSKPPVSGGSEPRQKGRRLVLTFHGEAKPELFKIEFRFNATSNIASFQQRPGTYFTFTSVPQALSLLVLDYVYHSLTKRPDKFAFRGARKGSLAASLGDAFYKSTSFIHDLFAELPQEKGGTIPRIKEVITGDNLSGKEGDERCVWIQSDFLPTDCIAVIWDAIGKEPLAKAADIKQLKDQIRRSLEEPITDDFLTELALPPVQSLPAAPPLEPQAKPEAQPPRPWNRPAAPRPNHPPIDRALFEIQSPEGVVWKDAMPLLDLSGEEDGSDIWRLKDAAEGVLILGAPGSGKTSGSGFAFAGAFLTAGFGGLVLAAKPEEARRWERLCARFGRAQDCVVVTRDGSHKLNVLDYETQRPRRSIGLTDDLIAFFRVLIAIVSKRTASPANDDFWTNATNQLMRALFDVFLLAEEPMTIDGLIRFVTKAPQRSTENWQTIAHFGEILSRAGEKLVTSEDRRVYADVFDYWIDVFPTIADATRSGIVTGFTAMASVLSGRGIHDLICSETTLTPEMILSGKIVILDLPLKECGQGGLLIQAAWKFLFQRAIERRSDKGGEAARPVFLWEDEAHFFFSQHDIEFQPTARDCRAAHVLLSQNLHNFYQLGHNPHAVQGVFATINTQVFHANGDLDTNKWASDKIGTEIKTLVNVSVASQPKRPTEPKHWFWDAFSLKELERESTASTSVNQHRERTFQPEEFVQLKKGGDGSCEAIILWVSHQFKGNKNRPFRRILFEQDSEH